MTASRPGSSSDPHGGSQVPKASAAYRNEFDEDEEDLPPIEPVDPAVLAQILRESQVSVLWSVGVQWAVSIVVTLIAFAVGGVNAGLSAMVGAGAYTVPNTVLAFRLLVNSMRSGNAGSMTVLLGEFLKMGAVVALLAAMVKLGGSWIVWPALLAGLIAALKSYWVGLALAGLQRKGPQA